MEAKELHKAEKRNHKPIIFLVSIISVVVVVIFLQWKESFLHQPNNTRPKLGFTAPNFTLPGIDGKKVSLADYKGKVVFLNIWATWCPTCREEMPSMEKLYEQLKGKDFEILTVSVDASGAKAVAPFMKAHKLTFPVLLDTSGGTIQNLYGTTGVPESFIIDKAGIIEKIVIGPIDWSTPEVVSFFKNLLQKP